MSPFNNESFDPHKTHIIKHNDKNFKFTSFSNRVLKALTQKKTKSFKISNP